MRQVYRVRYAPGWPLALARIQRPERGRAELDQHGSAPCSHLGMEHAEAGAGAMLVACLTAYDIGGRSRR